MKNNGTVCQKNTGPYRSDEAKETPDPGSAPFVPDDAERIRVFIREQAMHTRDLPGGTPCQ